ncbi:hypothetical protein [Vibrio neptunius]|uniref:hypothetical protein n=1 Tax=Vibrio neptunius TaxID=170651 RepID=UPI0019D22857|nr:hypothetical protein [Vibrio neptunius]MBN3571590.1 hypothetical protein [Vibrio neptunius]QXX05384.1 hypothetical protein KW548_08910 [Vibrio neptunius]
MPFFILVALLSVLLILFSIYFYFEAKRKKEAQDAKKALTVRVEKMKRRFKSETQQWMFYGALSKQDESTIIRLPNYFFVFQPITPANVDHYEQSLESVLLTVNEKVLLVPNNSDDAKAPSEPLYQFIQSLPSSAQGYNASFYRNDLPVLIQKLRDAEIEQVDELNREDTEVA